MNRIALTSRVETVTSYGEQRDCLDQAWTEFILSVGGIPMQLSNCFKDVSGYLDAIKPKGLILTGGNNLSIIRDFFPSNSPALDGVSTERDRFERDCTSYCVQNRIPIIGVCRGLQQLNVYFGGGLISTTKHAATRHALSKTHLTSSSVFHHYKDITEFNSYHDFGIDHTTVSKVFQPLFVHADGTVEAMAHQTHPIYAMMWHPEREKPFNKDDIALFQHVFQVALV